MKKMDQAKRILYALTDVDDGYVAEALEMPNKDGRKKRGGAVAVKYAVRPLAAAAACIALVFAGYSAISRDISRQPDDEGGMVGVNPVQEAGSLEEAEKLAGFGMEVPKAGKIYSRTDVTVFGGSMIEVEYLTEDGNDLGYYIRKALGTEDASGDYNEYPEVSVEEAGGREITLKGNNGRCSLATWTDGTYYYAIGAQNHPMAPDDILRLAADTR